MMYTETVRLIGAGAKREVPDPWMIVDTLETCRIYYIHAGQAVWSSGENTILMRREMLYFFPPNLPFYAVNDPSDPLYHTFFDFIMAPPIIMDHPLCLDTTLYPPLRLLIAAADAMITQMDEISSNLITNSAENQTLLCCLNGILNYLPWTSPDLQYVSDLDILAALDRIHTSYHTDLTVNQIAKELGYHEDHFIRKFRQVMKTTPYHYLKSIRLHEARRLRQLGMTYAQIADAVGYGDASALCHAMKKSILNKDL